MNYCESLWTKADNVKIFDLNDCVQVIWRFSGDTPTMLAANTKLSDWIPQNDLLGTHIHTHTQMLKTVDVIMSLKERVETGGAGWLWVGVSLMR